MVSSSKNTTALALDQIETYHIAFNSSQELSVYTASCRRSPLPYLSCFLAAIQNRPAAVLRIQVQRQFDEDGRSLAALRSRA
jgi:hypothetical protein